MPSERRRERRSPNPLGYKFRRSLPAAARLFRSSAGKQPGCQKCHDACVPIFWGQAAGRSEEHTSELQSLMRISYAVFCLKKKKTTNYTKYESHNSAHHHTTKHYI